MELWDIARHALLFGLILSAVLFAMILALLWYNAEIMLKDYPPDIQAKYGPMSERSRRQRIPVAIGFTAVGIVLVAASFSRLRAAGDISFKAAFKHLSIMFSVFNLLDWLLLDWLIVVRLQPKFIVLPGTEGMAGYQDYWFHFRGFLIGVGITLFMSALIAAAIGAVY